VREREKERNVVIFIWLSHKTMLMIGPKNIVGLQHDNALPLNNSVKHINNTVCGRANLVPLTVAEASSRLIAVGVCRHQSEIIKEWLR